MPAGSEVQPQLTLDLTSNAFSGKRYNQRLYLYVGWYEMSSHLLQEQIYTTCVSVFAETVGNVGN